MNTTPETQDTRTGWERHPEPRRAAGPHPYLAGAIDGFNDRLPEPGGMFNLDYRHGYHDGVAARRERERLGGDAA